MKKISVLALLLAVVLLLAGCSAGDDAVIVDVNGQVLTKGELNADIDSQIAYNQQLNSFYQSYYGVNPGLPTDRTQVANALINSFITSAVSQQKAKEMGMDQFTEEENAQIQQAAQEQYDSVISQAAATYFPDLEGEEATKAAVELAKENGATLEIYQQGAANSMMLAKLEAECIKDIEIDAADVDAALTKKAEEQKAQFDETPSLFGDYVNQKFGTVYYAPEGYRMVKHVLVMFTEEDTTILNQKRDALTQAAANVGRATNAGTDTTEAQAAMDAAQAELDAARQAAMANIQPKVDEVYALATAEGADFDALVAQYNEDTGMPQDGYAVCDGYASFVDVFTVAAMGLENVGDVSEPTYSDYGCHIILYSADVPAGASQDEATRQALHDEMLAEAQDKVFNSMLEQWVSEADVKTYPERLK